jgi:branched-chain amino acid aminotransferase
MVQIVKPISYSQTWTFFEGEWHDGNVPIMGPRTHAAWLGSTVFDGPAPSRALRPISIGIAQGIAFIKRII